MEAEERLCVFEDSGGELAEKGSCFGGSVVTVERFRGFEVGEEYVEGLGHAASGWLV
jgi:hypothetical protein